VLWENYSFVIGSRYRMLVLESLKNKPKTPTQISEDVSCHITHISRALIELESRGLVICLTPNRAKFRVYSITENGRKILELVNSESIHP
jgi:DNA-binding HxlR family transcriptional regulator